MLDGLIWFLERVVEYTLSAFASWEAFTAAGNRILETFTDFENGFAWPFLLASFVIAIGVYWLSPAQGATQGQAFRSFLFPRSVYGNPSAILDYKLYGINTVLKYFLILPILIGIGTLGQKVMKTIVVGWLSWTPPSDLPAPLLIATAVGVFLLFDFITYCSHVLFHKVPAFWAFHRVHHSAEVLTPFTAYRVHPMEVLTIGVMQAPAIGFVAVFYGNLLPEHTELLTVFGVSLLPFLFHLVGTHLHHSHVWLSFGPTLNRVFMSPAQHQIHHSRAPQHRDKNFGVKFSVWDTLFGTLYSPSAYESIRYGILEDEQVPFETVGQVYGRPFVQCIERCRQYWVKVSATAILRLAPATRLGGGTGRARLR